MYQKLVCPMSLLTLAFALPTAACLHATVSQDKPETKLELTSSAFKLGEAIPTDHTCDGKDISPGLKWSGVPSTARSLSLICDDPDAPAGTWVHRVLYDLPSNEIGLAEGAGSSSSMPPGATQGTNDFKSIGYGGPCPPPGNAHRYFFKLYALDVKLDLKPGATKSELVSAMNGHILAEGQLMGTYQRK